MRRLPLAMVVFALAPRMAAAMPSSYPSVDAAAVAFVDLARSYPDQRKEYCAWLIKDADGKVRFGVINDGDMNHCPSSWPKPAGTAGSVHTHPIWGGANDPGAASQMFSDGDFAHGEAAEVPVFLGGPAGHVLRYDPGGTSCWGSSFIARRYKIVRDAAPSVRGKLPLESGAKTPLFDAGGKPIPKPAYCKDARS